MWENYDNVHNHNAVQEMEQTLQIETQWLPDGEEWNAAVTLVVTRRYRLCINKLEELVLKRLFELTKMNMSQTALACYNLAAHSLTPKRCKLTWDEVVEYAFLSNFNILQDPTSNAALRDWLMDSFFRIEWAKEEIPWLNIEIRRLITYICDERIFLVAKEAKVMETDPHMAYFIWKYHNHRGRSDGNHMTRLRLMKKKLGSRFTGMLVPGVRRTGAVECNVEDEMDMDSIVDVDEAEAVAVEAEIA
ncbi:hypothetical protein B0H17DRAFT_1131853 [Mycena rosella]|uniref:Uncharacterized protein n=1 Tax=Mycena rosella TaxID=1033263 RepID=A0AAD7DLE6_MYCRO|nr:hypothetical protein B0H17DRAFT_1131853 [Mycena rosella]